MSNTWTTAVKTIHPVIPLLSAGVIRNWVMGGRRGGLGRRGTAEWPGILARARELGRCAEKRALIGEMSTVLGRTWWLIVQRTGRSQG